MDDKTQKEIKLVTKYTKLKEKINKIDLSVLIEKIVNNIIESDEDLYPENINLIMAKCDDLTNISEITLENDILSIFIFKYDGYFTVNIYFLFDERDDNKSMNIDIEDDNYDMLIKLVNNFDIMEVSVHNETYTKEQLMGG